MINQILRKLIEVEVRLGFLSIPTKNLELLPDKKEKVRIVLGKDEMELSYNPEHRRIFGLTKWYKENSVMPGDLIILTRTEDKFVAIIKKQAEKKTEEEVKTEAKEIIDISGLSSQAKGDIVEDRIKELLLLHGQGLLNVYKPVVDTEGIDLIIVKNGQFHPIFIQSKGRYSLHNDKSMILRVKVRTFNAHSNYYVVGAFFDPKRLEIADRLLLIPSKEIVKEAGIVKSSNGEWYNIVASLDPSSKDRWSKYAIDKNKLAEKLLGRFSEIEEFII